MKTRKFYTHNSGLKIKVYLDEDNRFCAEVPRLPGCVVGGNSLKEVLSDINLAIDMVLENKKLENK